MNLTGYRILSVFFFILISASFVFSQYANNPDNPNYDHLPLEYLQQKQLYKSGGSRSTTVVTINGYDNYKIGTDFAEPHMSVNPNDPLQYFNAYNTNGAHRTFDGHEWLNSTPNFGTSLAGDPVTAHDYSGNLYYMNMYGFISGAKVMRSTNNGNTWLASVTAVSGVDKCWLAADQTDGPYSNYVYAVMTASGGGNVARSTNLGASFQQTATLSTQGLPGMMVCVGPYVEGSTDVPGGAVYVVTNGGNTFSSTYTFYRSTNGGQSFQYRAAKQYANYVGTNSNGRHSVENMRTRPYPFITADNSYGPYRGRLYLVYASNTPSGNGNKPDIFCRYSDDGGVQWSNAVVVNDDPQTTGNHQFMPAVWCDIQTGRLHIHWMDSRDTPTSDYAMIYGTYSDDGGVTFKPNVKISNDKMKINCTTCGGGGSPRYQGDYDAVTSYGNIALHVWTDFRDGSFDSYVGYLPDFAMTVSPSSQTISNDDDTTYFNVNIPSVKLYEDEANFSAELVTSPVAGTISLSFPEGNSISSFPGSAELMVVTSGNVVEGEYTIKIKGEGPNGIPVHYRYATLTVEPPGGATTNVVVMEGWNMVSVPRMAADMSAASLFPGASSNVFGFDNGYVAQSTLENGEGYWVKFGGAESIPVTGEVVTSNIQVSAGWNMIGPFEENIAVASITSNPPGIISSVFYGFSGAYDIANYLNPGKGYWVKTDQDGEILIQQILGKNTPSVIAEIQSEKENWGKIIITDKNGRTSTLYAAETVSSDLFEMPPAPPAGIFDARFSTGKSAEDLSISQRIELNSAAYPVKITLSGVHANISSDNFNSWVNDGNSVTITDPSVRYINITEFTNPVNYELAQNYPNPFNPSTTIKFSIPEKARVAVRIFNSLGEEVESLLNRDLDAGAYEYEFDAAGLSSGIYFYQLEAGSFTQTKKMILMK